MKLMLSSCITGYENQNREAFAKWEKELTTLGHVVINPSFLPLGFEHSQYMSMTYAMIDECDGIALFGNWNKSKGAVLEYNYARRMNKLIYDINDIDDVNTLQHCVYENIYISKPSIEVIKHKYLINDLHSLFKAKNIDYGNSFIQTFEEEGFAAFRIRLTDKLDRFKRLSKTNFQSIKDESIKDTLMDMANYALMAIICLEKPNNENNNNT